MAKFQRTMKTPKATNEHARRVMVAAQKLGYDILPTRGKGHMKLVHECGALVFAPLTPSDNRSMENTICKMRRELRMRGVEA